jgi:diaminohydroxyphosphoribosylaminopyrimidine deaminase / 5-amino-6-(5-phosphoribosylamino)uracil reductase
MEEKEAMHLAITCARSVEGRTAPRPAVGAVVVQDGIVVGQGATAPPFGPHAEIHALNQAGERARGADLYVTLEPCCITVHTPPCTRAIIEAGIQRVFIGSRDPNPRIDGQGMSLLRNAGIEVISGIERVETDEIVRPFATFITKGRPYITAKWAMTLDGKLASRSGDAYWISGPEARVWVHNLRDRCDAILIGAGTLRSDDPLLTVRLAPEQRIYERTPRPDPLRIVLSTHGDLPVQSKLLQPDLAAGTCIVVGEDCSVQQQRRLQERGVEVVLVGVDEHGRPDLLAVLQMLAHKGLMHVLIEGGSNIFGNAFDRQFIDHVAAFIAPKIVGGKEAISAIGGQGQETMQDALQLQNVKKQMLGEDVLIEGDIIYEKRDN